MPGFQELHRRLVLLLLERVRNGEMTERGLARVTGISQPHIHNVLKGKRLLSKDTADAILVELHLDVLDLVEPRELLEWQNRS
jgi:transcriptional regulator with XRE-family HTH domain